MSKSPRFSSIATALLAFGVGLAVSACGSDGKSGGDASGSSASGGSANIDVSSIDGDSSTDSSSSSSDATSDASSSSTDATATTGTSSTGSGGATAGDPLDLCGGTCQCGNGIDDDGDGNIDGFDAECTGAADDDEGSFATGIPGDNRDPKWQDCFFDGNSGAGDDDCKYHTECLTGERDASDPSCTVTQDCIDFCGARTPNGCDCFGCCTIETNSGSVSVYIIDSCDLESLGDEDACPRCQPSDQCGNDCGECELCPGKDELPAGCDEDTPQCDDGREPCDENTPCSDNYFCQFGCCTPPPTIK